jgi:hypothetical protein
VLRVHETRGDSVSTNCAIAYQRNSPQSYGMAESFVNAFKRDYVGCMDLSSGVAVLAQLLGAFRHLTRSIRIRRWGTNRRVCLGKSDAVRF